MTALATLKGKAQAKSSAWTSAKSAWAAAKATLQEQLAECNRKGDAAGAAALRDQIEELKETIAQAATQHAGAEAALEHKHETALQRYATEANSITDLIGSIGE